jgi:mRNA interferase RelE/StbE
VSVRYTIELTASAEKEMAKLTRDMHRRVVEKVLQLEDSPRPAGAKHLEVPFEGYRIRIGDWRVLYCVDDTKQLVTVYAVRHRREVYRKGK